MTTAATRTLEAPPSLSTRDLRSFTAVAEKKLLVEIATRLPAWVGPDHLTALGAASMAGAGLFYRFLSVTPLALLGVNLCLFLNWFGDSLDGTLARVRQKQRPRYGFYLDHLVDAFGAIFLFAGLATSGLASPYAALAALIVYLLLQIHIALKAHTTRVFQIAFGGIGGTESRILIGIANTLLFVKPELAAAATVTLWVLAAMGLGLIVVDAASTARSLDAEERALWSR